MAEQAWLNRRRARCPLCGSLLTWPVYSGHFVKDRGIFRYCISIGCSFKERADG